MYIGNCQEIQIYEPWLKGQKYEPLRGNQIYEPQHVYTFGDMHSDNHLGIYSNNRYIYIHDFE